MEIPCCSRPASILCVKPRNSNNHRWKQTQTAVLRPGHTSKHTPGEKHQAEVRPPSWRTLRDGSRLFDSHEVHLGLLLCARPDRPAALGWRDVSSLLQSVLEDAKRENQPDETQTDLSFKVRLTNTKTRPCAVCVGPGYIGNGRAGQ